MLRVPADLYQEKIAPVKNNSEQLEKMKGIVKVSLTDVLANTEECKNFQNRLIEVLYTEKGPRGDWRPLNGQTDSTVMEKCLEAGNFGLMPLASLVNSFLEKVGLPEPLNFYQEEMSYCSKHYLILRVTKDIWEEKINAVKNNPELLQNSKELAKGVFVSSKF